MVKPILAIDVDMVVVDTGAAHWEWLCKQNGVRPGDYPMPEGPLPYNLGEIWGCPVSAMDFWRQENLYDALEPIKDSVEVLRELSKKYDIIFASAIKGLHPRSKYYFLRNHFPFLSGVVLTKEKHYVKCDYIIDDRLDNLARMPSDVVTIQYNTPYKQTVSFDPEHIVDNWKEAEELLRNRT